MTKCVEQEYMVQCIQPVLTKVKPSNDDFDLDVVRESAYNQMLLSVEKQEKEELHKC